MFNTKELLEVFDNVKHTASRNEKTRILTEYHKGLKDDTVLIQLCRLVFDQNYVFYVAKIPKVVDYGLGNLTIEHHLSNLLPSLNSRALSGNSAKSAIAHALSHSVDKSTRDLLVMILKKKFDIGADLATFRIAFNQAIIKEHQVMLCSPCKPNILAKLKWPMTGQVKYDAMRIEAESNETLKLTTRSGKSFSANNQWLCEKLQQYTDEAIALYQQYGYDVKEAYFDGEMLFLENDVVLPREVSNGVANSCLQGTKTSIDDDEVRFYFWDIITDSEKNGLTKIPYGTRYDILSKVLSKGDENFKIAETRMLYSFEEAKQWAVDLIKSGQEGIIIKDPTGVWENKRVSHQVKLKAAREVELLVVGYNIAEDNKYHGLIGSVQCCSSDKIVNVNISGLTDSQRKDWLYDSIIGKIVTVRYNEIIKRDESDIWSLFLPRIVEVRHDKVYADSFEDIKNADFVIEA